MASRVLYVPISTEAAATVIALQALAQSQVRSLVVLDQRANDALLLEQTAQLVIVKQFDHKAFTPLKHNLTVILPLSSEAFVQDVTQRHPDMPRSWCLIHASEGIATAIWLKEMGAMVVSSDGFTIDGAALEYSAPSSIGAASELDLYRELQPTPHNPYDVTAQTLANSVVYSPTADGWHDMSGRAAHIICGPYLFLPPGQWKIDLDFDIDCDGGHIRLFFEWGAPAGHRNNFESVIKESGNYNVTLETHFGRPDAAHCLVATNASHLQGRLRVNRCLLTRLDAPHGQAISNWS